MQFAAVVDPARPLSETDWLTFMPAQVQQAIYMAARLPTPCPHNSTIPILDTRMGAIKQQAEDAGFLSAPCDKNNAKFIRIGNRCSAPQNTFWKGFLQSIAVQLYFNSRGGFSTAPRAWQNAGPREKQQLGSVLNMLVRWVRTHVPDRCNVLFPCEIHRVVSGAPVIFILTRSLFALLLSSISRRA